MDPAGLTDGLNRYAYVRGRPASAADQNGNTALEKTEWGDYKVGTNSPLGKQQEATRTLEADLRSESELLAELQQDGASEVEIEELRNVVADLEHDAFIERAVLDLAAGDQSAAERVRQSDLSMGSRVDIAKRALSLQHDQAEYDDAAMRPQSAPQLSIGADGVIGTDAEHRYRNFSRGGTPGSGPTFEDQTGIQGWRAEQPLQEATQRLVPGVGDAMNWLEIGAMAPEDAVDLMAGDSRSAAGKGLRAPQRLSDPNPLPKPIREQYEEIRLGGGTRRLDPVTGQPMIYQAREFGGRGVWHGAEEFDVPGTSHRILRRRDGRYGYVLNHDYTRPRLFPAPWYPDGGER